MWDFLRHYQLDIMLVLIGVCGITAFFVMITRTLSKRRKLSLLLVEIFCTLLLVSDRLAYLYRGDVSRLGYWMVRISNFYLFLMTLSIVYAISLYITDLLMNECSLKERPLRSVISYILIAIDLVMLIISQFTGWYYTFDETNHYVRAPLFLISYILPVVVMAIQLSLVVQFHNSLRKLVYYPLVLFLLVPLVASIAQLFAYGISLINMSIVGMAVVLFAFVLADMNATVWRSHKLEVDYLKDRQKSTRKIFEQTATALVNAIDAKDKYTHGHSSRVAEYSRRIAEEYGMSEEECDEVYFAALLHDVGKIGVPGSIINKEGKLTGDEYAAIKEHPKIGENILSSITGYPSLSIGAHYHHERYDGKGYPEKLKGEDIPEIARIVAVADAYDAMTSKRSYRDAIPQIKVREEIIKGSGNQFDPIFARIMQHLIDLDVEYELRERSEARELAGRDVLQCGEMRSTISEGIHITENKVFIHLKVTPAIDAPLRSIPELLLFDSNDGHAYKDEKKRKDLHFFEYGSIGFDGQTTVAGARDMQTVVKKSDPKDRKKEHQGTSHDTEYSIEAVRYKDHALITIEGRGHIAEVTVALPDSSRYLYIGLTGQYCILSSVSIDKSEEAIGDGYIRRIAEEISYIKGPAGDIPNVQIDGYRTDATEGIPITDGLKITFHSMSLPTAELIWHCAFINIFHSADRKINGEGYREFALIRLDGEYWEADDAVKNEIKVRKTDDFTSWEDWKETNKKGIDCSVTFTRKGNTITTVTENMGIHIKNVTSLDDDDTHEIYTALSGDQVALTDIRIIRSR